MATMDDIAKRLGISKGTVSKAMNGAEDVSEAMRKAVLETAVELGYTLTSRTKESPRICILIENMDYEKPDDFGWDLVTGFRKAAEPQGYTVEIVPLTKAIQKKYHYDEFMLMNRFKGAFVVGINYLDIWVKDFQTCTTPTVLLDNSSSFNPFVTQVGTDNEEGVELAVAALKKLGHTAIGYLSNALGSRVYQERYMAFFHALRKNDMNDNHSLAGHAYYSSECLEHHLPRLLKLGCTAIICSNDLLAYSLLIHCQEKGIRVPQDLSIVGIDDLPLCRYTQPSISSVRQDRTALGKSAFYAVTSQIAQIHINTLKLHPELVLRGSVSQAPSRPNTGNN